MKFFLDENFPAQAKKILTDRGHETFDIRGTEQEGIDDLAIFNLAQDSKAIFLTTDKYFYHTIALLFSNHFGVVAIALSQPNSQKIINKLSWALDHFLSNDLNGRIFLMTDARFYQKNSQ